MIAQVLALRAGPLSKELADTVRRVNAQHIELANGREIPALKEAFCRLDRNLSVANAAGDEVAARRAVVAYGTEALAAIEEA